MIPEALFIALSFKLDFEEIEVYKCILRRSSSTNILKFLNERN